MKICYIKPKCKKRLGTKAFFNKAYLLMLASFYGITTSAAELEKVNEKNLNTLDKLDSTCESALAVGQRIGYWVCVFMCIYEIVRKIKDGDTNAILGIIVKYAIAYGSIFLIRIVLDLVGGIF